MNATKKAETLKRVVALLEEANALQQQAIGVDTDVSYNYHCRLEDLIDDVNIDIEEFEAGGAQ